MRGNDLIAEMQSEGLSVYDTQFVYGITQEGLHRTPGYQRRHSSSLSGVSKQEMQANMMALNGSREFYTQNATILLCGGEARKLSSQHVTEIQQTVMVGGGLTFCLPARPIPSAEQAGKCFKMF